MRGAVVSGGDRMTESEWLEWLAEARDDELRAMVRDFKTKAASDCENELDNRNQRAYESTLEDYYSGSGPQTDRERAEVERAR